MESRRGTTPDQCAQVAEWGREGVGGSEGMPAAEGAVGWGMGRGGTWPSEQAACVHCE